MMGNSYKYLMNFGNKQSRNLKILMDLLAFQK